MTTSKEEYLEPETIRMLRGEDTSSLSVLTELAKNVIKNTVAPFVDFYVFENVVHILNDIEPDVGKIEGSLPEHIWLALEEIKDILGSYPELSDEVETYIRYSFHEAGISFKHPALLKNDAEKDHLRKVVLRSQGPYPIIENDDVIDMQAIKFLKLMEYINARRSVQ